MGKGFDVRREQQCYKKLMTGSCFEFGDSPYEFVRCSSLQLCEHEQHT